MCRLYTILFSSRFFSFYRLCVGAPIACQVGVNLKPSVLPFFRIAVSRVAVWKSSFFIHSCSLGCRSEEIKDTATMPVSRSSTRTLWAEKADLPCDCAAAAGESFLMRALPFVRSCSSLFVLFVSCSHCSPSQCMCLVWLLHNPRCTVHMAMQMFPSWPVYPTLRRHCLNAYTLFCYSCVLSSEYITNFCFCLIAFALCVC